MGLSDDGPVVPVPPSRDHSMVRSDTWWYLSRGGCPVTVAATSGSSYGYHCTGCDVVAREGETRVQALAHASQHAERCRAMADPRTRVAEEIARELAIDLRAELPRIDARAAAGIALSAAVLVATVGQAPTTMPTFAFATIAAGLLTIALLLFFMVLLPVPGEGVRALIRRRTSMDDAQALMDELASWDRAVYHATAAVELSAIVHAKHRRLVAALALGGFAVLTLASGASLGLLQGGR